MKRLNCLILGGQGFIGKAISLDLINRGHTIITIGKSDTNDIQVDFNKDFYLLNKQFDIVINTVSIVHNQSHATSIDGNLLFKDLLMLNNIVKTINSCSFSKLIHLSSVAVYGLDSGVNVSVETSVKPKSGYGISKAYSEKLFQTFIPEKKLLILRLPLVNGVNAKGNIKKLLDSIDNKTIFLFNHPSSKSILELVDLTTFISLKGPTLSGIHQIKSYDIDFNTFVKSLSQKKIPILPKFVLKTAILFSKILLLSSLHQTLIKMSKDLTFKNTIKLK